MKKALFIAIITLGFYFLIEFLLRIFPFRFYYQIYKIKIVGSDFLNERVLALYVRNPFMLHPRDRHYSPYIFDRYAFYRLKPNFSLPAELKELLGYRKRFSINSYGVRGKEVILEKENRFRILCLGDSSTFGTGKDIGDEDTYPFRLEEILKGEIPSIEVINAGVPGYSSENGRRFYYHYLEKLKPDLLVISFGFNDFEKTDQDDASMIAPLEDSIYYLVFRLSNMEFIKLMRHILFGFYEAPLKTTRVSESRFLENHRAIIQKCKNEGTGILLLNMNFKKSSYHLVKRLYQNLGEEYQLKVIDIPASFALITKQIRPLSINLVHELINEGDLNLAFAAYDQNTVLASDLMGDLFHPSTQGYEIIARILAKNIKMILNKP